MNKHFFFSAALLVLSHLSFGQGAAYDYADDAFRFSDFTQSGTARFRGLGGNQAALGGDASNLFGNAAGLAFYNRSELSISPTFTSANNQSTFLGQQTANSAGKVSVGQFSAIFANKTNNNGRLRRSAWGISYSQSANFFDYSSARGLNNNPNSSIAQSYVESANLAAYSEQELINGFYPGDRRADFKEAAAYGLYLINPTVTTTSSLTTSGPPYTRYDVNTQKDQQTTLSRSGTHSQWTLAYAGNIDDKLYIGGSVALTHLRYSSEFNFLESPINGTVFTNYGQINRFDVKGNGINASLGIIYKLIPDLQVGATIVSPTISSATEVFGQTLSAVAKDPNLQLKTNFVDVIDPSNNFEYTLQTPLRGSFGATYFINKGKIGFITATAEYVDYAGMRVRTSAFTNQQDNTTFKNDVKAFVQDTYQSVVNVRAGAEIRAGLLRVRAGVGYMPSAYKLNLDRVEPTDRSKLLLSAGLGMRNDRFFADLAASYLTYKSGYSPYQLDSSSASPTVAISNRSTNVMLSVGVFF